MIKKPMLSATVTSETIHKLEWPMLGSYKIDGIRCIYHPDLGPVTRSFKPIPNRYIREAIQDDIGPDCGLDGELVAVDGQGRPLDFNSTQSAVMSQSGEPEFCYMIFDRFDVGLLEPFYRRYVSTYNFVRIMNHPTYRLVDQSEIPGPQALKLFMEEAAEKGYEGVMLRDPHGPYKEGRSTLNQGWLVKYKEWADAEGTIIGFEERMHNSNPDIKDAFGYAKRSSALEGMVGMGTLGALVLDTAWGELRVGSGFDDSLRQEIWNRNMVEYLGDDRAPGEGTSETYIVRGKQPDVGRRVTFKYQPFGMKDKPRFPIFLRFREDE